MGQKAQLNVKKAEAADGASDEQSKADSANFELREKMKEEESKIKRRQAEEEAKAASAVDTAATTPPAEMKFRNVNHDKQGRESLKHVNTHGMKEGNGAGWVTMSESLANDGDKSVDMSYGKKPQIQTVSEGAASTPPTGFMARFKAREDLKHAAADGDAQAIMRAEERLRAAEGVDAPAAAVIAAKEDSDRAAHVVPLAEK